MKNRTNSLLQAVTLLGAAAFLAGCDDSTGPLDPIGPGDTETFEWSGQLAPGGTVEIKNLNGNVRILPGVGNEVRVAAVKRGRDDDPSSVRIDVVETAGRVTVCAVYPDVPGLPANQCLPGALNGQLSSRHNDVTVKFDVHVPADAEFVGGTINGDVRADGVSCDVFARTVSGDIDVSTAGLAEGSTTFGDVTASIGGAGWGRNLEFTAINGNVSVRIPGNAGAEVWGATLSGSITTDFPLSITGGLHGRQMVGTLGSGGPSLRLSTNAGDIALRSN